MSLITPITCMLSAESVAPPPAFTTSVVYRAGTEGYASFRIPSLLRAANGDLLAFAEGRVNSDNDAGDIDLVLKRSSDGGLSWTPLEIVRDDGSNKIGNPTPILLPGTGRILLLTMRTLGTADEMSVRDGTKADQRTVWSQYSDDHGATWSEPVEISDQVKNPEWHWYALGPGQAIVLRRGEHAGRIVVAACHSRADGTSTANNLLNGHAIYSDDGGVSWSLGMVWPIRSEAYPNESRAVELTDGRIYFNARDQGGPSPATRAAVYSNDGGASSDPDSFRMEEDLIAPVVQGSLLRYSAQDAGDVRNRILFSSPNRRPQSATFNSTDRRNMTVRSSFDETNSWTTGRVIHTGPSGYSDMARLTDGRIGLLYERGPVGTADYAATITYHAFTEAWLDTPVPGGMIARWDFESIAPVGSSLPEAGSVPDTSGNGLDATNLAALQIIAGAESYGERSAVRFTGAPGQGIRLTDLESRELVDFSQEQSFTIEAIFRTTAHSAGQSRGALVGKEVGFDESSWWLRVSDGNLQFLMGDGNGNGTIVTSSGITVNDGQWHHVAAVRDSNANQLLIYVDHQLYGSVTDATVQNSMNSLDLLLGNFNSTLGINDNFAFQGDIDEVRISGSALEPGQFIQTIHQAPRAAKGTPLSWLQSQFGDAENWDAVESSSPAGNGQPAWAAYKAGLDPWDPQAVFRIVGIEPRTDGLILRWRGSNASGESTPFTIETSTTLEPDDWRFRAAVERTAEPIQEWIETELAGDPKRYYRIVAN